MTSSIFSARGTRPTGVVRFRWRALGATVGVLLTAMSLVTTTPDEPAETSVAAPIVVPDVVTPARSARVGPAPTVRDRAFRLRADPVLRTLTPDPSPLTRSRPTRVRIPAIAVDSELVGLGLRHDGRMEVPPGAFPAGWYTGAPTPGELGPAILAGHVDHGGTAGVFYRLRELEPGDTVEVVRQDGSTALFRVTRVEQHRKDAFPTAAVYGDIDHAGLRLITCGGPFDRGVHSYEDNIVVFAELDPGDIGAGGHHS